MAGGSACLPLTIMAASLAEVSGRGVCVWWRCLFAPNYHGLLVRLRCLVEVLVCL